MIKQTLFPKIKRMEINKKYQITEKLDGSNLGIAKLNYNLYFCQRNIIFNTFEIYDNKNILYKDLENWIIENKEILLETLNDNTILFGEWLGMGHIKYKEFKNNFNIFAKAKIEYYYDDNVDDICFKIDKLNYNLKEIKYAFRNEIIPNFINIVPIIDNNLETINKQTIDELYDKYSESQDRIIEGFVILDESEPSYIRKYVRCKNGNVKEHFQWENI
ncbi:RNA ligase family protein [Sneathia sanguinegens]|uniref:RNA ligase family protein n=1 Tax=Sneathia sanguinegens TaxID=40543 RepID=UPI00288AA24E|nr:RNA ligase family protein [Sneathia sanguinegens]